MLFQKPWKTSRPFLRELAEIETAIYIPAIDLLNKFYSIAQVEARISINPTRIESLMEETANRFDNDININDPDALATLNSLAAAPISAAIVAQAINLTSFIDSYAVEDRDAEIVKLVATTYQEGGMSQDWLTDRGWKLSILSNRIEKEFETDHTLTNNLGNWEASDSLTSTPLFGKGPTVTLASGKANAREDEFDPEYRGITRYHNLNEEEPGNYVLPIIAYASKDQRKVKTKNIYDLSSKNIPLSGIAIAHVEHRRPEIEFNPLSGEEYSNLYNPFWQARLVGASLFDIQQAFPDVEIPDFD